MSLDLTDLDAVTAQLDLAIGPAQQMHPPTSVPTGHVTRTVQTLRNSVGTTAQNTGHEALTGLLGVPGIAKSDTPTPDPELTTHTRRNRLPVGVQNMKGAVGQRPTDRNHGAGPQIINGPFEAGTVDGGLGETVGVDETGTGAAQLGQSAVLPTLHTSEPTTSSRRKSSRSPSRAQ